MVFISGLFEIDIHFKKREYFKKYQSLIQDKLRLEIDWRKIQIDLSEISSGLSLEKDAEIKAEMIILDPSLAKIVILNEQETKK
jgi:cell division protein FtsL